MECNYPLRLGLYLLLSALYLLQSSHPSLTMETVITKTKGTIAETGWRGEISGMDCRIMMTKK